MTRHTTALKRNTTVALLALWGFTAEFNAVAADLNAAATAQSFGAESTAAGNFSGALPGATGLPILSTPQKDGRPSLQSGKRSKADKSDRLDRSRASLPLEADVFQKYVQMVSGKEVSEVSVFGRDLFSDVPNTFAPTEAVQVNPDYLIGPGDELQIRGWGMVDIDVTATVDRSGSIYIPRVGAVKVAGIRYRDLQGDLKKAIGKNFSGFDLTASIAQTRAVQVYVVGHANRPGTYTLSAMSTLLNALFSSGGPSATGTMRSIEVKRGGRTVTTFDLYDMIVNGDKTKDIPLQDGDVIHIPEAGPKVALIGDVKTPGIFELKGDASASDAINWAGGFDSAAQNKPVIVEKNIDNAFQTIAETTADGAAREQLNQIPLRPADVLRVFSPGAVPIQAQIRNEYVQVAGEVAHTGMIKIRKGESLRELIARLGGVTDNAYVYATQLRRESVRISQQTKLNEVADRFERDLETTTTQRIAATTDPATAAKISTEATSLREQAWRLRQVKAEGRIVLELEDGSAQVKNLPDIALQDGDTIIVPRRPGTVDVLGAVFQQNSFIYKPHRTVGEYVAMAGGATPTAEGSQTYLIRADGTAKGPQSGGWFGSVNGTQLSPGDSIVVPEKLDRTTWVQTFKEWTTILYQFGLGAAGLKVLKD